MASSTLVRDIPKTAECRVRSFTPADAPDVTPIYANFVKSSTGTMEIVAPDESETIRRWRSVRVSDFPISSRNSKATLWALLRISIPPASKVIDTLWKTQFMSAPRLPRSRNREDVAVSADNRMSGKRLPLDGCLHLRSE